MERSFVSTVRTAMSGPVRGHPRIQVVLMQFLSFTCTALHAVSIVNSPLRCCGLFAGWQVQGSGQSLGCVCMLAHANWVQAHY